MNEKNKSTGDSADDIIRLLKEKAEKERTVPIEPFSSIEKDNKSSKNSTGNNITSDKTSDKKKAAIIDEEFRDFFTTPIAVNREFPDKKESKKKGGMFSKKSIEKAEETPNVPDENIKNSSLKIKDDKATQEIVIDKTKSSGIYKNFANADEDAKVAANLKNSMSDWQAAFSGGENYPGNVPEKPNLFDSKPVEVNIEPESITEKTKKPIKKSSNAIDISEELTEESEIIAEPVKASKKAPKAVVKQALLEQETIELLVKDEKPQISNDKQEENILEKADNNIKEIKKEVEFFSSDFENENQFAEIQNKPTKFDTADEIDIHDDISDTQNIEIVEENKTIDNTQMFSVGEEVEQKQSRSKRFFTATINNLQVLTTNVNSSTKDEFNINELYGKDNVNDTDVEMNDLEYESAADAPSIKRDLLNQKATISLRLTITSVIASVLLYLTIAATYTFLPLPPFMAIDLQPKIYLTVCLILFIAALGINIKTIINGICGIAGKPTPDTFVSVATLFALIQLVIMISSYGQGIEGQTIFCGIAVTGLAINAFGKKTSVQIIRDNFNIITSGVEQYAAYTMNSENVSKRVTRGLAQTQPQILVSRSTSIVKGFLKDSFAEKNSDKNSKVLGIALAVVSLLCGVYIYITTHNAVIAASCASGAACLGASFAAALIHAVPAGLMQSSASRVGAVIAGPKAMENLENINVIEIKGKDLFPHGTIALKGIKTFREERIDLAILYAASILVEACETLRGVFLDLVEGKRELLYKVEDLKKDVSNGFIGTIEGNEVIVGNRQIMSENNIETPSMELENKYTKDDRMPIYLAVSGKLFGMFIVDYSAEEEMFYTISDLREEHYSLLVKTDDFSITNMVVARCYGISPDMVKVMDEEEKEIMKPYTEYASKSDGDITHIGSFASYVGGLRAAKAAAGAEKIAAAAQIASVVMAILIILLLTLTAGLGKLSVFTVLMYQLSWLILTLSMPLLKKY